MSRLLQTVSGLSLVMCLALTTSAHAYDSKCRLGNGKECKEGMETARKRWTAADSEHRLLWEDSIRPLKLPKHLTGLVELQVPTDSSMFVKGSGSFGAPTVRPFPVGSSNAFTPRQYSIGEMAQLPDFSYGLWDWAFGNEACPLPLGLDPDVCHSFKQHMGAVNSSHFLPQAQNFYHHYHKLALAVARECSAMRTQLNGQYPEFVEACDQEAFTFEAIGHHFLQDAWSVGHMWQRWGGPDLADFGTDPRPRALMIGAASGLIHGARGLLQEYGEFVNADVLDPLCAPLDPKEIDKCTLCISGEGWDKLSPPSYLDHASGNVERGVGDLYYDRLTSTYGVQSGRLLDCAGTSILELAQTAGLKLNAVQHGPAAGTAEFDKVCFGQRATNGSIYIGAGIDIHDDKIVDQHIHIGFSPLIASRTIEITLPPTPSQLKDWFGIELPSSITVGTREPSAAEIVIQLVQLNIGVTVPNAMEMQFRRDMANIANVLATRAIANPDGVDVADNLPNLIGMKVNSNYQRAQPATYVDPLPPYTTTNAADPDPNSDAGRGTGLARAYHRAHAQQWCNTFDVFDLEQLKTTQPGSKCDICVEFAQRHLRIGEDEATHDANQEPLCFYLADAPRYIYQPTDDATPVSLAEAARDWCGCGQMASTCKGSFAGLVVDSETQAPVLGAFATFVSDFGQGIAEGLSDGSFSAEGVQCATYNVDIEAPGYLPAELPVEITESVPMLQLVELKAISEDCADVPSEVVGWVQDGVTGDFVGGALVEIHEGLDAPSGPLLGTTKTDDDGVYAFDAIPRGYYTLVVDASGYESGVSRQVSACGGDPRYVDSIYVMPTSVRALSFVLNWARPNDLDLRLMRPNGDEVSFGDCAGSLTEEPFASLDVDHRMADGPEVMTVSKFSPGKYKLIVHNFSGQNSGGTPFLGSEAELVVYNQSSFYDRYNAPSVGSGSFWDVLEFEQVDGEVRITPINTLTDAHSNPFLDDDYSAICTPKR